MIKVILASMVGVLTMCACTVPSERTVPRSHRMTVVSKSHIPATMVFNIALGIPETSPERWELVLRRPDGTETREWVGRQTWEATRAGSHFDSKWP